MARDRLVSILTGNLTRTVVLLVLLPLIGLSYFGTLATAARFTREPYDWRRQAISRLLYPGHDPMFHSIASCGIALTGLLLIPFAGYIRRRLRDVAARTVDAGAAAFYLGAIYLLLAGLVVSHPHGTPAFPRLHEILARTAAFAFGAGMILLWGCAAKAYFASLAGTHRWRRLFVSWSLLTLPAILIALLRVAAGARLEWPNPLYQALENRSLWHLGFWEWIGSAAVFLFLLSAALFLPESAD